MKTPYAKKTLKHFYGQELMTPKEWPSSEDESTTGLDFIPKSSQSPTLKRLLQKSGIETGWQHTPSGNGLSVTRMALGEAPFKKSKEGVDQKNKPAVFYLNDAVIHELNKVYLGWKNHREVSFNELDNTSSLGTRSNFGTVKSSLSYFTSPEVPVEMSGDRDSKSQHHSLAANACTRYKQSTPSSFEAITAQFFQWLQSQCTNDKTCWLVTHTGNEEQPVEAGRYSTPPQPEHINKMRQERRVRVNKTITPLDKAQIKSAVSQDAELIEPELLKKIFKEFLGS